MRDKVIACVALGANLGDARTALQHALAALKNLPLTEVRACSRVYRTAALDDAALAVGDIPPERTPAPDYLNAVVALETGLTAPALLAALQGIETAAGRQRPYRNAPRTLDLDLLLYGSARIDSASLTVPHPRMCQRAFVLVPLAEIAPQLVNPAQLAAVQDQRIEALGPL